MNKSPLIKITPLFIVGLIIAASGVNNINSGYYFIGLLISTLILINRGATGIIYSMLMITHLILLGVIHYTITEGSYHKLPDLFEQQEYQLKAEVLEHKLLKDRNRLILRVNKTKNYSQLDINYNILLYTKCNLLDNIPSGSIIILDGIKLQSVNRSKNNGYSTWLKNKRILKIVWENNCTKIKIMKKDCVPLVQKQRNSIQAIIHQIYYSDQTESIIEALIIGDKSNLDSRLKSIYTKTGAIHILAISGLHVGLIFLIPFTILTRLTSNPVFIYSASILVVFAFTLISGASPSVLRAFCMLTLFSIGKVLKKPTATFNILYLSALFLLIIDPRLIFQIGFQLSFMAVFGILSFNKLILSYTNIKNKILNYLWQINVVSISAQLGTIGISLYYFNAFAISFPLSGIIVIPLAPVIITLGLLSIVCFPLNNLLAIQIANLNTEIINLQNYLLEAISEVEWLYMKDLQIDLLDVVFYYFFFFWFALDKKKRVFLKLLIGMVFMLIFSINELLNFSHL